VSHLISEDPRQRIIDRELSWLAFNERVLELAEDTQVPLLERCRFLAIFSSNLDDFFMIRVATLKRKLETGVTKSNTAGYTPTQLMDALSLKTQELLLRQSAAFHEVILPELALHRIELAKWDSLDVDERERVNVVFHSKIFPVLTPLAVDPSHPFPYISGLSLNLAVVVKKPGSDDDLFARVKVPSNLPRFVETGKKGSRRFVALEEVIIANLAELFQGMEIRDHYTFRLTRNADLELEEEESEDLLATMEQELLRRKFGPPVRLEVDRDIRSELLTSVDTKSRWI
jgi:polyphosphate kinase